MLIFKLILLLYGISSSVYCAFYSNYDFDTANYFEMPKLNDFDDYDGCMDVFKDEAKYCYVKSVIKPDNSSLFAFIKKFSNRPKQHFRHDKLTRGICVNLCERLIKSLDKNEVKSLYQPEFNNVGKKLTFDFVNFPNFAEDREAYNVIINQCINYKLMKSHNLSAYSSLEYCRKQENQIVPDFLDYTFIVLFFLLLTIIAASSIYDEQLRIANIKSLPTQVKPEEHYKRPLAPIYQKFLVAFSIHRNWYILSAPTRNEIRDLRAISAVRIWTMIPIVFGHAVWFSIAVPLTNTYWVDKGYHVLRSMIIINGGNLVQSFLFIGGFLNSFMLLDYVDKNQVKGIMVFIKTIIYRVVRFVPVLLFLVLLHATWIHRFDDGPFWDKFTVYERQSCRTNMWTNLLLINNYVSGDMKCMIHTWYIATDFQLGIIGTALILVILNNPKRQNLLLFGSVVVSFIISFAQFYFKKLEPILILPPETLRNQLIGGTEYDRYFYDFHSPTHLNMGNYLIGLVIGYFYYQKKQASEGKIRHRRSFVLTILWHLSYMATFLLCFVGIYFYENDMELGFFSAFLGAFFKHIYGPILGFLLVGIFLRYGWVIPKLYNYGMYRVLARLSFSVYMIHFSLSSLFIMKNRFPVEINNSMLTCFTAAIYVISHGAALFLALCIELPAHVIYKTIVNEIIEKPKANKDVLFSKAEIKNSTTKL
ncbi:hypothetical protein PVAND_000586 [Polypedilum vanderplanki]|uniref:Acyltransferase 3 domain-containing protein n=1 Tax=Polypedilum vanderplanki TaxID=319348 RepID=A0A9J6BLQ2_POLVA|nr:hypothetical protein PVAND_000586 [Polypedilum vanderplanki]